MKLTPKLLIEIGEALYDPGSWKASLGAALGVDPRTIRRWALEQNPIPAGVEDELCDLLAERANDLLALRKKLKKASPAA